MQVRDEDRVDVAQPVARRHRLHAAQRSDPGAGHRIGQQADPIEVDDERGVADEVEGEPPGHRQALRAASG